MEILKFDSALEILCLNKDGATLSLKDIQKRMPFRISGEEASMILDKFRSDSLIVQKKKESVEEYFITYAGVKFYQKGGYLGETIRTFFKKLLKISVVALGVISTIIGIALGLRELF